jgi:hypothetical protein
LELAMNTTLTCGGDIAHIADDARDILMPSQAGDTVTFHDYKTAATPIHSGKAAMRQAGPAMPQSWRSRAPHSRSRFVSAVLGVATAIAALSCSAAAQAQVIARGDVAVSGYSGSVLPQGGLAPGVEPNEQTIIDTAGPVLRVLGFTDLQGPPAGAIASPPIKLELKAGQIGQVFSLAFDDNPTPGLFAGATSFYGIQITAGAERLAAGAPGARFADGQFGAAPGSGPGTVWRIDGATGEAKPFANITLDGQANSGPGLGDVAFDGRTRSLFVSDLDTGMIHRLNGAAADTAQFDHGVSARPANDLPPLPDDGKRMDIASPDFKPPEPESWGLTPEGRRVLALAVHEGRLFYSVAEGGQIWSVGLAPDGSFLGEARLEAEAPVEAGSVVTDIAFDGQGRLYAAQRGSQLVSSDLTQFAEPAKAQVFRFTPSPNGFIQDGEDYPIGLRDPHRMSAGGLTLSPSYNEKGRIVANSCGRGLLVTGDHLTDADAGRIDPSAPGAIHGLQLTADVDAQRVRPPLGTYYIHFNKEQDDPNFAGHVGDVEALQKCDDTAEAPPLQPLPAPLPPLGQAEPFPPLGQGEALPPGDPFLPQTGSNLAIAKVGGPCAEVQGAAIQCTFTVTVTNDGPETFEDVIVISDTMGFDRTNASFSPPWTCAGGPSDFTCSHPAIQLQPGGSVSMEVVTTVAQGDTSSSPCELANTAVIAAPLGGTPGNASPQDDAATGTGIFPPGTNCLPVPQQDPEPEPAQSNLSIQKTGAACTPGQGIAQQCAFTVTITNTGATEFAGPLTISETLGISNANPAFSAPWTCAGGPAAFTCNHPPATLAPGQSVLLDVTANVLAGDIPATPCSLPNTAAIIDPPAGSAANGLPGDDSATAEATLPADSNCRKTPNLSVDKGRAAFCTKSPFFKGYKCPFVISVRNTGSDPFTGPLSIVDEGSFGGEITVNAPWTCDKEATVARDRVCTHPGATIPPGKSLILTMDVFVPFTEVAPTTPAAECRITNTARLTVPLGGTPGNQDPDDDIGTATSPFPTQPNEGKAVPCDPPSLKIEKTSAGSCKKSGDGWDCDFAIKVTSVGPDPFQEAPIEIDEIMPAGAVLKSVSAPWTCTGAGGAAHCVHPKTTLAVGESVALNVTVAIPDSAVRPGACRLENTARITTAAGLDLVTSPQYTATASSAIPSPKCLERPASPKLPLTIVKTGDSECQSGRACRFTLTIANPGLEPFAGPVTIADGLSMAGGGSVSGARLVSVTPPLGCASEPTALPFNCTARMTLGAGERRVYAVSVMLPEQSAGTAGAAMRNCAVIADPTLPDRIRALQAQGRASATPASTPAGANGTGGGYSCHDFRVQAKPAGCQGGLVLNDAGRCICPPGTEWNGRRCLSTVTPTPLPRACPPHTTGRYPNCKPIECPRGTYGRYPDCRRDQTPTCPEGTTGRYPNCKPIECPRGTYGRYPDCRRDQTPTCPEGTTGRHPNCKPIECPRGTYGRYPDCRRDQTPTCPEGTTGRYPNCKPIECPPGTYGRYPDCRRDRDCPQGTRGRYPDCKPIECPPGTYGRYPLCKREQPCPSGTTGRYPNCKPIECPPGTYGRYPDCRRDRDCPQGTRGRYPDCKPIACPPGTYGRPPRCVPIRCPEGTYGRPPNCRPAKCPAGMEGTPPNCRPVRRPCPPGTIGRFPYCRPPVDPTPRPDTTDRRCPPGTIGRKPWCRPMRTDPTPQPQPRPDWNRFRCPPGYIGRRPYCRPANPQPAPQGPVVR